MTKRGGTTAAEYQRESPARTYEHDINHMPEKTWLGCNNLHDKKQPEGPTLLLLCKNSLGMITDTDVGTRAAVYQYINNK